MTVLRRLAESRTASANSEPEQDHDEANGAQGVAPIHRQDIVPGRLHALDPYTRGPVSLTGRPVDPWQPYGVGACRGSVNVEGFT